MAVDHGTRRLRLPPSNLDKLEIPKTRLPARNWYRIHQSRFSALHFSLNTIHRFSHEDCPCPLLYLAVDTDTCSLECFGDKAFERKQTIPQSLWMAHRITCVHLPALQICDLTDSRTLNALKLDLSALMNNDLTAPQAWGLALQRHPARFQGIRFKSRFNGKDCLAVFKRDGIEARLRETPLDPLPENDAALDWLDTHKV